MCQSPPLFYVHLGICVYLYVNSLGWLGISYIHDFSLILFYSCIHFSFTQQWYISKYCYLIGSLPWFVTFFSPFIPQNNTHLKQSSTLFVSFFVLITVILRFLIFQSWATCWPDTATVTSLIMSLFCVWCNLGRISLLPLADDSLILQLSTV